MPAISGASHISLSVTDVDDAIAWFRRVFDADVLMHEPGDERTAAVLTIPATDLLVGLTQHRGNARRSFDPAQTGLDHFAFAVATEQDLEAWAAHLSALGVEHSGAIPVPPGAILNLRGPDGIALALLWRR